MKFRRLIFILSLLVITFNLFCTDSKIDSMLQVLSASKLDTNRANTYNSLCWAYMTLGDFKTAKLYSDSSLAAAQKLKFERGISWALNSRANVYKNLGNYIEALNDFNASLKIREKSNNKHDIAVCLGNMGVIYKLMGNFPEAQRQYLRAMGMYEELGEKSGVSTIMNNVGEIFRLENNLDKALECYEKSKKIREDLNDEKALVSSFMNIGAVYFMKKEYEKALENFKRSGDMAVKTNRAALLATAYLNIGSVNEELFKQAKSRNNKSLADKYSKEAISYYNLSAAIYEKCGDRNGAADTKVKMGSHYSETGNLSKAQEYLFAALKTLDQMKNKNLQADCYRSLSEFFETKNDFRQAHLYYKKYVETRDSILSDENIKKTLQQQMQYDFDRKAAEQKAEQEKTDLKNSEEKRKQAIILWFTFGGLLIVFVLAVIILRSLILNKRKNKIITEQKRIVEEQKHTVELKQKEILDSIRYAKRIQASLLASEVYIDRVFKELKQKSEK